MLKRIPSLNGLRAFSIIFVLIAHVEYRNLNYQNTAGGQVGVTIFFVLSGFLITYLLLNEELLTGAISLEGFFYRRAIRIFPVFYFLLLVYFILQLLGILHIELSSWLSSITYTKYFYVDTQKDWETQHLWSLSVEEHFYLIWPLVFRYGKKYRNLFVWAVIGLIPLVRLMSNISAMNLFTRADAIMWGCALAIYYKPIQIYLKTRYKVMLLIPFLLLLFCLATKKLIPFTLGDFRNHILVALFGSFGSVTNICVALIIIISIEFRNNMYFNILNSKPLDFIGKISYSLYLWQQLFFSKSIGRLASLPLNLVCIALVSFTFYRLIEAPFLKLKKRYPKTKATGLDTGSSSQAVVSI